MLPILYTDTDKVRASLGLTDREVSDAQITDANVELQLKVDLQDVYPDHAAVNSAAAGVGATENDKFLNSVLILYCQYQVCIYVIAAFQMLTVQKLSDGDFEMSRFQRDNLQQTVDRITALRDKYRKMLRDSVTGITTNLSHISVASPSYDPVLDTGNV